MKLSSIYEDFQLPQPQTKPCEICGKPISKPPYGPWMNSCTLCRYKYPCEMCGQPKTSKWEKKCKDCQKLLEQSGICAWCAKEPRRKGSKYCEECGKKANEIVQQKHEGVPPWQDKGRKYWRKYGRRW